MILDINKNNLLVIAASCVFLVFDVFDNVTNQSVYLGACLLIDFCYSINETVYKETLKIFCNCKKNKKEEEDFILLELKIYFFMQL